MAITTPKGEQIQFVSAKTGTHNLDTYLEAAEVGNRQLHDLLDDMFDSSTGVFKADNFQFRFDTSTDKLQVRVGQFANSTASWTDVTTFFKVTGAFSTSTSYNNFDLVTLSTKDIYIVHGLTSATAYSSESNFISSANTEKLVDVSEAKDWAIKTDGQVSSTDYSSKAWAIGGTGVTDTASKGAAKEWATKTSGTVDGSDYSAKHWATTGNVAAVSGAISNINTVAGISANITSVAGISSNVTALAATDVLADMALLAVSDVIADMNVLAVADVISDLNTLATADVVNDMNVLGKSANVTNMNTLAGISSNITSVAGKASLITSDFVSDLNTLAVTDVVNDINLLATSDIVSDLNTLAVSDIISDLNTLATSDIVSDINVLATSDIVSDLNQLATSDFVSDLNAMATTANINNLNTVAGISSNVSTVAGISANTSTVAGISGNVTTVAGISSAVSTVAADGSDIGTVAGISSNVSTVAGIASNVTTVAGISSNVTTVAGDTTNIGTLVSNLNGTDTIGTVAGSISNVNTVGGAISNVNTVAGAVSNVNSVAAITAHVVNVSNDASDIGAVAGIISNVSTVAGVASNVSTVAGISSNVSTVAGISSNVTAVANDASDIGTVASNINGANTIGTVSGSISNVNTVGGAISNVNTVATNISSVNDFADKYRIGSSDPSSSNDEGDLFYNTSSNTLKVYTGSSWEQGVTAGSGFLNLTGGQMAGNITFSGSQTVDGRDLSADGSKLDGVEAGANVTDTANVVAALTAGSNVAIASNGTISSTNTTYSVGDNGLTQKNFTTTLKSKLDGIESNATADQSASQILTAVKTVDGASSGLDADLLDGQHGSYYTSYADTAVSNLVSSAPSSLDTLNELAAALGDDANFSTTVTNSIATKLPKSGGQMTGNITMSGSQTVDGRDLSVDGAKLDGIAASANNYSHPTYNGDDFSVDTGVLTGATVVSDIDINITTDTQGHVTDANGTVSTRTLTLANLGYTGATNANNYVHPNHSGEVTSSADGATVVASNVIDADNLKVTGNGSTSQFLRSDGDGTFTWATPTDTNTEYTVGDGGLTQNNFTNTLKSKLDGVAASANNYSHPTGNGNNHIPANGAASQVLTYASAGTAQWADPAGAKDDIFYENSQTVSSNYTLTTGKNAVSAGPIKIASGVTVTVPSGAGWAVV